MPTINVRYVTNVDELRKNLAEGLDQIEATRAGAEKLVKALSGDNLIQAAHKWAAAIQEMGGVQKLTTAEQERAIAIWDKAIAKLTALGKPIPSLITEYRNLAKAAVEQSAAHEQLAQTHSKLGEFLRLNIPLFQGMSVTMRENIAALGEIGIAVGVAAGAFELGKKGLAFGEQIAQDAKQLRNLSIETGVGVEALQAISGATDDFGVSADELGRGLFQLSRRIAGNDQSAKAAITELGLSFEDLKKKKPDEVFLDTVRALNQIPDPLERARLAAELFGGRFGQAILAIGPNLDAMIEKVKSSGEVMSGEAVKGAADFADAMDHLSRSWKAWAGEALAPSLELLAKFIDLAQTPIKPPTFIENVAGGSSRAPASVSGGAIGPSEEDANFRALIERQQQLAAAKGTLASRSLNPLIQANDIANLSGYIVQLTTAQRVIRALAEDYKPLTSEQRTFLDTVVRQSGVEALSNATLKQGADSLGISAGQLEVYRKSVEAGTAAHKKFADAIADMQSAGESWKATLDTIDGSVVEAIKGYLEAGFSQQELAAAYGLTDAQIKAVVKSREAETAGLKEEAALNEILAKAKADVAKAAATSGAGPSIDTQLAAIDAETTATQRAASDRIASLAKAAGDETKLEADQATASAAIAEAGQAKKQAVLDTYHKRETDAEAKLRAEIAGLDDQANQTGLAKTLAAIDAKQRAEVAALDTEVLTDQDHQLRMVLIDEKADAERRNARLENARASAIELLAVDQQIQDAEIALTLTGMQQELAINEVKRQRRLEQLRLEGKDTAALIAAENQLFDLQADAIIAKFDPIRNAWAALNTDLRQEWADTWARALKTHEGFVDALLSPFKRLEDEWLNLLGAMVADWEGQFLSKLGINIPGMGSGGVAGTFGSGPGAGGVLSLFGGGGNANQVPSDFIGPLQEGQTRAPGGLSGGIRGISGAIGLVEAGQALKKKGKSLGDDLAAGVGIGFSLGGPYGAAIGLAAGFVAKGLSKLFSIGGPSAAEKAGRDVGAKFQQGLQQSLTTQEKLTAGTSPVAQSLAALVKQYTAVGLSADEAGRRARADLNAIWAAEKSGAEATQAVINRIQADLDALHAKQQAVSDGVDAVTSAWQKAGGFIPDAMQATIRSLLQMNGLADAQKAKLQGLLDASKPNFDQLKQTADGFGVSLAALGPKFEQGDLEGRAKKITDFISQATQAGGDLGGILAGTADEISALVQESQQFGTAIPDNMRPFIENLIAAGKLLDANGNAITDVGSINFEATPLNQGLEDLNKTLNDLIDALNKLNGTTVNTTVNTNFTQSGTPPTVVPGPDNQPQVGLSGNDTNYGASTGGRVIQGGFVQAFAQGGRVKDLKPFPVQALAGGGRVLRFPVMRPANSKDTVPIWATPGELLVNREQQTRLDAILMHAMILAQVQGDSAAMSVPVGSVTGPSLGGGLAGDLSGAFQVFTKALIDAAGSITHFDRSVGQGKLDAPTFDIGALIPDMQSWLKPTAESLAKNTIPESALAKITAGVSMPAITITNHIDVSGVLKTSDLDQLVDTIISPRIVRTIDDNLDSLRTRILDALGVVA